ncbi:MAG TPA: hypothetical protein VGM39_26450 [Kofleriaceae bacterium]
MSAIVVTALVAIPTAEADTLIARAAKAAASGDFLTALAYADSALAHSHGDDVRQLTAARDSYGGRWALQLLDALGSLTDANAEVAFGRLTATRNVLATDHLTSRPLDEAITVATNLLLARAKTLEASGDLAEAEALLAALVTETHAHADEQAQLRARATTIRLAQAPSAADRPAHPGATILHLQAAARYGDVPSADLAAAHAQADARTQLVVTGTTNGACFGQEHAFDRAPVAGLGVPVHLAIDVTACTTQGPAVEEGSASLSYTQASTEMVPRSHIENKGYECHTVATAQGATTYVSSYEQPGCAMPLFVVVEDAPERREIDVTATETVSTSKTRYSAHAAAHTVVTWPGGSLEHDDAGEGASTSLAYGSPEHAVAPPSQPAATAEAAGAVAVTDLANRVYAVTVDVRARLAQLAIGRAAASSDPLFVEDELVIAALLTSTAPPELVSYVREHYGMTESELRAALFGTAVALPELGQAITKPEISSDDILDEERTHRALFLSSATGRSSAAISLDFGYSRSMGTNKDDHGAFVFAFNYFGTYPDASRVSASWIADIRYGRGGLLDGRFGAGGGVNLNGVLLHPFVALGFDRLGLSDPTTLHYAFAAVAEAGLRAGFAIPHLFAADATVARRRRIDVEDDPVVENRVDLELRVQPVILDAQYTQLSTDKSDLTSATLSHETGQLFELLLGFGF